MRTFFVVCLFVFAGVAAAAAQTTPRDFEKVLGARLQAAEVTAYELQNYMMKKVPPLPPPGSAEQWTKQASALRQRLLDEVIFHGWPREWVDAPPKVEDLGPMPSGEGYRMRKLRYEIVPGFITTAVLYEPSPLNGRVPAVLNVNGHAREEGKALEYKQKRCINMARRGILALNVEWLGMGELNAKENAHRFSAHLDLVGANGAGLFYLAMRKGLDYLYNHPHADRGRIGVTGLSGGGWQTIVLSALDERVTVAVPVAGFASYSTSIANGDIGDNEQSATDLIGTADYSHLVAMRAPRPTLLIHNAEDNCCYRGPLVKDGIFDRLLPFFRMYGGGERLEWHENTDPSTHNYQLDNRQQAYRFFTRHFGLPVAEKEIPVDAEVRGRAELDVGIPADNLTILGLARRLAAAIHREAPPAGEAARLKWAEGERARLRETLRYTPVTLAREWALANTKSRGLETMSYRFEFSHGISATGVWAQAIAAPGNAPATIVLHDEGKKAAGADVSERVNRGEQVLALDLLLTGDLVPNDPAAWLYSSGLASLRDRSLGMRVAQLIETARWLQERSGGGKLRVEANGMRSQVTALSAAALRPDLFAVAVVRNGVPSLQHLLDAPVEMAAAPELFCLDLYKHFDLDRLAAVAAPVEVVAIAKRQ